MKVYNTVLKAQEAALEASRPGITCQELDQIARQIITEAGYGQYFTHRLGHGLGISIHEYPSVTGTNPLPLKREWCLRLNREFIFREKLGYGLKMMCI